MAARGADGAEAAKPAKMIADPTARTVTRVVFQGIARHMDISARPPAPARRRGNDVAPALLPGQVEHEDERVRIAAAPVQLSADALVAVGAAGDREVEL